MSDRRDQLFACPSCLGPNTEFSQFCVNCGSPVGTTSTLDPMSVIRAEALVLDQAVNKPQRGIVVLGIWIIFFPVLLMTLASAIYEVSYDRGFQGFVFFWVMAGLALFSATVLIRVTKGFLRHRS